MSTTTVPARPPCRLYLITPPAVPDLTAFAGQFVQALEGGDVAALQIRLKEVPDAEVRRAVEVLAPIAQARDVAVILNDRADLAKSTGCDGVHLGQQDGSVADARRLLGPNGMIGVTCHDSRHLAMEAAEAGADYVAFGAFFPTTTKTVEYTASPDVLTIWQETMEIPCVAIGGVDATNARTLAEAGADFVAVSGAVWSYPAGPAEAVRALNAALRGELQGILKSGG